MGCKGKRESDRTGTRVTLVQEDKQQFSKYRNADGYMYFEER